MAGKSKLVAAIEAKLTTEQRRLLQLITFESHKNGVTVRLPQGLISLEGIWEVIAQTANELSIKCLRADTFATLDELDGVLTDIHWLWHDWIPKGFVSMLVGDPGIGKSVVALDFVRIITTGDTFPLVDERAKKSNAVWIDTEASQQLLNIRSKRLGVDRTRVTIPVIGGDILAQINITIPEHREQILSIITAKKPTILVLDSLSGSHNRGENKVEDIKPIMEFFAQVARDYDIGVLIIHHLNKSHISDSPEISLYRIRGSMAIPQFARSILALESITDNTTKLRVIKSNLSRLAKPITVVADTDKDGDIKSISYQPYAAPERKKLKKEMCAEWVLGILESSDSDTGVPLKELEDMGVANGYTRANLYAAKEVLGDRVAVTGTGRTAFWHLADLQDEESVRSITGG